MFFLISSGFGAAVEAEPLSASGPVFAVPAEQDTKTNEIRSNTINRLFFIGAFLGAVYSEQKRIGLKVGGQGAAGILMGHQVNEEPEGPFQ